MSDTATMGSCEGGACVGTPSVRHEGVPPTAESAETVAPPLAGSKPFGAKVAPQCCDFRHDDHVVGERGDGDGSGSPCAI